VPDRAPRPDQATKALPLLLLVSALARLCSPSARAARRRQFARTLMPLLVLPAKRERPAWRRRVSIGFFSPCVSTHTHKAERVPGVGSSVFALLRCLFAGIVVADCIKLWADLARKKVDSGPIPPSGQISILLGPTLLVLVKPLSPAYAAWAGMIALLWRSQFLGYLFIYFAKLYDVLKFIRFDQQLPWPTTTAMSHGGRRCLGQRSRAQRAG
jgi:hypothetical protein